MNLPKEWLRDPDATAKAEAMLSRHSDQAISDYLGMSLAQVESIRRNRSARKRGRPVMRTSECESTAEERWRRHDAQTGSAMLWKRICEVYGVKAA